MHTRRSGRPFLNLMRACGAIGSTQAETACVLEITVEDLQRCIDGDAAISVRQADRLAQYLMALWWWHCYRSRRPDARERSTIQGIYLRCSPIWLTLPERLIIDWQDAHLLHVDTKDPKRLI